MSIKISARRYILELGLTSRKWDSDSPKELSPSLLVCEIVAGYKKYNLVVGMYSDGVWVSITDAVPDIINNVVCWSEIKI